jgi:hypothetical protein
MNVSLSNYDYLSGGVELSNSSDILANSFSLIEGGKIVNIKTIIETVVEATMTPPLNWLYGDSTAKNTISTGDGLLTISIPEGEGDTLTFSTVISVNGPYITGEEGHATFYNKSYTERRP